MASSSSSSFAMDDGEAYLRDMTAITELLDGDMTAITESLDGDMTAIAELLDQARSYSFADLQSHDPPPAAAAAVNDDDDNVSGLMMAMMKTVDAPAGGGDGGDCPICLNNGGGEEWKETACGHRFHGRCVARWARVGRKGMSCPMCRRDMMSPAVDLLVRDIRALYGDEELSDVRELLEDGLRQLEISNSIAGGAEEAAYRASQA